jgi:hypothetical protein
MFCMLLKSVTGARVPGRGFRLGAAGIAVGAAEDGIALRWTNGTGG